MCEAVFSTKCGTSSYTDPKGREGPDYTVRQAQKVSVVLFRPTDV